MQGFIMRRLWHLLLLVGVRLFAVAHSWVEQLSLIGDQTFRYPGFPRVNSLSHRPFDLNR